MNRHAFLSEAADRGRVPVVLLSGFLGSGKTTLVNALLRDPRMAGTAVAVNEFGEVPVDQDLIDHGTDKTVVLANGCLCCNLAGDMEEAVMRLFSRREGGEVPRFDRLLIEPSGLADPAPIAQAILRNPLMARSFRLEAIIATVDALFGAEQLARYPETRKQVALADRLVLTKTDLAEASRMAALRDLLSEQNPAAPILQATFGAVDPGTLLPASFFDPDAPARTRSLLFSDAGDPRHTSRYASLSLATDNPLLWRPFEAWLRRLRIDHADRLLRVKGLLHVAGADGPVIVQGVHHVLNAPVELDTWPDDDRRSRLVLIADRATIDAARESWAKALPSMTATN